MWVRSGWAGGVADSTCSSWLDTHAHHRNCLRRPNNNNGRTPQPNKQNIGRRQQSIGPLPQIIWILLQPFQTTTTAASASAWASSVVGPSYHQHRCQGVDGDGAGGCGLFFFFFFLFFCRRRCPIRISLWRRSSHNQHSLV